MNENHAQQTILFLCSYKKLPDGNYTIGGNFICLLVAIDARAAFEELLYSSFCWAYAVGVLQTSSKLSSP